MYPRAFDYIAPESKAEALDVLAERGDEVKVLAGGQSLIPMMKLRFATPDTLLDINRMPDLGGIDHQNGYLRVQALARHNDVVRSQLVADEHPAVAAAAPWVADPLVRNLGTMCGSVAHHDPEGDWASVMLAVGADVVAESRDRGQRVIPITDFLVDMFTTVLAPDELLTELRIPRTASSGGDYQKLERKVGDYATVGVSTHLELDADGKVEAAGIALTSVYPHNLKVTAAEELLAGQTPSDELFAEAAHIAEQACEPTSDVRGSAEYKRAVVRVFTERSLAASLEVARRA